MATGATTRKLGADWAVSHQAVSLILAELTHVFSDVVYKEFVRLPTFDELVTQETYYRSRFHLPNCIGSIDGSFFRMKQPVNDRAYHCYKKYYAIIILTMVDMDLKFVYFNAGAPGSVGDAAVWNASTLCQQLHNTKRYELPPVSISRAGNIVQASHPRSTIIDSYVVVDSAFRLSTRVMKCYESPAANHQAFNAAVTAARQASELAFGRYSGRWKVVKVNEITNPQRAIETAKAAAALHNICQLRRTEFLDAWRDPQPPSAAAVAEVVQAARTAAARPVPNRHTNRARAAAEKARDALCAYVAAHPPRL